MLSCIHKIQHIQLGDQLGVSLNFFKTILKIALFAKGSPSV